MNVQQCFLQKIIHPYKIYNSEIGACYTSNDPCALKVAVTHCFARLRRHRLTITGNSI